MAHITTIINFCSNEARFISHSIRAALACTDRVIVPFSDHFFSGEPENWSVINQCIQENPDATFVQIPFEIALRHKYGPHFWHNVARWVGIQFCEDDTGFALFLDADEVLDAPRFQAWSEDADLSQTNAIKFLNYWYFRDVAYQAGAFEDSVVMTRISSIKGKDVFSDSERHALKLAPFQENVVGVDGSPLIHHFSWVRTKDEMLKKVQNWGHQSDRGNWTDLVEEEFSRPFNGTDFVHGYTFNTVAPLITLSDTSESTTLPETPKTFGNKIVLSPTQRDSILSRRWGVVRRLFA